MCDRSTVVIDTVVASISVVHEVRKCFVIRYS